MFGTNVIIDTNDKYYARHKLSPRDQICPKCNALLWLKERIKVRNLNLNFQFVVQEVKLFWRHLKSFLCI